MSPDFPTHPNIFGDLRIMQLHISGASFHTVGDAPSVPTCIILSNRGRRWELIISDAYETDKAGKPLNRAPQASTPPGPSPEAERIKKLEELLRRGLEVNGDLHAALVKVQGQIAELEFTLRAERKLSADRLVAYDVANTEIIRLQAVQKQNQAEVCWACRKAAEDTENGVPLPPEPDCKVCELAGMAIFPCVKCGHAFGAPPEPDEDAIREAREKRDDSDERRHDAARQHAAEGG